MNEETSPNVENFGKLPGDPLSAKPTPVWSDRAHPLLPEKGKPWKGLGAIADLIEGMDAEAALRESDARPAENTGLAKLNELSSRLWHSQSLQKGLEEMLSATMELLDADMGNVQMLDTERCVLHIAAQRGFERHFLDFFREVSRKDDSACGRALRSGERIVIEDIGADALYAGLRSVARAAGYQAVQSTPLIGRDGAPLGMVSTHWKSVHRPSEADLRLLDLYIRQAVSFIERSRANEALRVSEEWLQLFVEHAPTAIAMFDRHMRYLVASRRWLTDYRLEGQDLIGRSHYEIFPEIPQRWRDIHGRCLAGAIETANEDPLERLDGSRQWLRWEIRPWKRANGDVGGIVIFTEDITDRKRIEQERDELFEQLKKSQQNLLSRIADLEAFYDVALTREVKIMQLEKEVERLKSALAKQQQK